MNHTLRAIFWAMVVIVCILLFAGCLGLLTSSGQL